MQEIGKKKVHHTDNKCQRTLRTSSLVRCAISTNGSEFLFSESRLFNLAKRLVVCHCLLYLVFNNYSKCPPKYVETIMKMG